MQNREVVIKRVECTGSREKYVRKEVAIMQKLDHPSICKLFGTYENGHILYFVMEYCQGGELFQEILHSGQISETRAAEFTSQIVGALNYAHARSVAHRDLKPENVCLVSTNPSDNHVKVIDWGLGFFFDAQKMKSAVGSTMYAAPEVLTATELETFAYTEACDLWSLGVLVYVMLCGKSPFWGGLTRQIESMRKEEYPLLDPPWPSISAEAKEFLKGLLRADPAHRLSCAQACEHKWLKSLKLKVDASALRGIMQNLSLGASNSTFISICRASAAQQVDQTRLRNIAKVFRKLDSNNDGCLDHAEFVKGFEEVYGPESLESQEASDLFDMLDLNGAGSLGYTEFCVAALDDEMFAQDQMLWATFKAFDVHGDDGRITKEEIVQVLGKADVREEVCHNVANEILTNFDKDGLGYLDFDAWTKFIRSELCSDAPKATLESPLGSCKIVWVSLDPRNSTIVPYTRSVAEIIERSYQNKEKSVVLGDAFPVPGAQVFFEGLESGPFQRTPQGLRGVRRKEICPGKDEISFGISGAPPNYQFDSSSMRKVTIHGVAAEAIDPRKVAQGVPQDNCSLLGFDVNSTLENAMRLSSMSTLRGLLFGSRPGDCERP
jgi:calcium-dependent protein kinase